MPLREGEPQVRKHYWLYAADVAKIKELFGQSVGESKAVRLMVRKCLQQIEEKARTRSAHGVGTITPGMDKAVAEVLGDVEQDT